MVHNVIWHRFTTEFDHFLQGTTRNTTELLKVLEAVQLFFLYFVFQITQDKLSDKRVCVCHITQHSFSP